ncbi:hypothetical protein EVAR_48459_1 [Eumeta japonica]|uniref:Uncharacterized protein n=1 Tax=Eumeta variegata TaxID=151549 RepID=A0A4C1XEH7_EUMVA|nr:hypothetical protein EVAR_48459_1 [Eumeta japonica]
MESGNSSVPWGRLRRAPAVTVFREMFLVESGALPPFEYNRRYHGVSVQRIRASPSIIAGQARALRTALVLVGILWYVPKAPRAVLFTLQRSRKWITGVAAGIDTDAPAYSRLNNSATFRTRRAAGASSIRSPPARPPPVSYDVDRIHSRNRCSSPGRSGSYLTALFAQAGSREEAPPSTVRTPRVLRPIFARRRVSLEGQGLTARARRPLAAYRSKMSERVEG